MLVTSLRAEEIAPLIYAKRVINTTWQRKLLVLRKDNIPNAFKLALLLPTVSKRFSMGIFLDCLKESRFFVFEPKHTKTIKDVLYV